LKGNRLKKPGSPTDATIRERMKILQARGIDPQRPMRTAMGSFLPAMQIKNEEEIAERIRSEGEVLVSNLFRIAGGDGTAAVQACALLMDRGYGRQTNDITVKKTIDMSAMHLEALKALAAKPYNSSIVDRSAKMIEVHATKNAAADSAIADEGVIDVVLAEDAAAQHQTAIDNMEASEDEEVIDPFS
jgi:hypothetical protein